MPWACKPGRSQKKSRENQWTPIQPALPSRSSRRVSSKQTDEPELPPPRPPRAGMPLKTVKEHPDMKDGDVVPTKSLDEVKNRYPVSGLAKRMSISASDLLGKSRDELILLLLQLNREKANLQRWHDYFTQQIELIRKTKRGRCSKQSNDFIEAIEVELTDVNGQVRSFSEPLCVTFLSNMLRMGDLFTRSGGWSVFVWPSVIVTGTLPNHLLPAHEIVPPKPSLTLAREVEAREVARTLNASKRKMSSQPKPTTRSSTMTDVSCTLANWIARSDHGDWDSGGLRAREPPADRNLRCLSSEVDLNYSQETASMRQRREQLESELADLEELCAPHSEIHKRLRETQRSLRTPDRVMLTNGNKIQGMIPHASGPSAALLRRLRSEQNTGNRRSGADSLWVRTRPDQDDDDYGLEWFELARPMDGSLCRETDTSGRTTPRRRNKSASARAQGITPIQDAVDTHTRAESIRTYHSIPDRLNLLTPEESNVQSPLTRQKSFEWEPLNRPLNTPRPVGDSVNKFSALQPEVFTSPTHTGRYYRPNYNMRSGHRDAERALDLVNEAGAQNRKVYPADSTSGFHYSSSDRLFREWSQPLMDSSERPLRRDSLRPTSDFIPNQRSIFGYSNERMDRTLEPDLLENGDIPRVVRPYSSNTNELRPNYSSPDLTRCRMILNLENYRSCWDNKIYSICEHFLAKHFLCGLFFSPPEPMKIEERYMPSPPQNESSDTEIRRSKEARLHAIRELLLRQRISGDFDHRDPPPTPHASQTKERVSHSAHLISMQAKLARDAVASVFQQAESRMQANSKLNA
ncbi:hypothetical protein FGIG_09751 [Fasciola gigantica]|uniref:Uncharacterized protein n=1 Tax=Fasciola gigantica TaxID=46835 RepID=A0A504Z054_FASGI|nr:hypothetical protein FGIG_09751 [Fasciola gigantica]